MGSHLNAWAIDLDGVVWRGQLTVPGAPEAVAKLRAANERLAFVTNSAARSPAEVAEKLAGHGIGDAADLVVTSGMAAASMIPAGVRAYVIGSPGLRAELQVRDVELVGDRAPADVVVVGISADFDYEALTSAMRAVRAGARFIATNDDATFPDANGLLPGNGAIVAAVATATGVEPEIAGKPHQAMAELVRAKLGSSGIVVGDRPETDGMFARSMGYRFGLVLSGVTALEDLPVDPTPDVVADDLADLLTKVQQ
ncbi:MAG: HAD-IIA family hydrolase [Acidimicrobiaceae bacterium]|nr:HAD-IIA family hydrolase [Acidimicrobiaceae bacterium]MYA73479.1 HAD-IIA family hydrolase [Acidimicrobiaceae bacterium]MYD07967.1 HAD-IIA family hydrolase [Acidimicrobiaceae bacterium]MYG54245.1 HAD-IIA family hydrolase [Acidimicrobiaceae bacterium]MYI58429.1 HAD-IIA family hydrolase [Acidimicrobiaceae bacterium]